MRILSKFQDYYDSGIAYGMDEKIVYPRATTIHRAPTTNGDLPEHREWKHLCRNTGVAVGYHSWRTPNLTVRDGREYRYDSDRPDASFGIVFFCGRRYPFYIAKRNVGTEAKPEIETTYSWEDGFDAIVKQSSWDRDYHGPWRKWLEDESAKRCDEIHAQFESPIVALLTHSIDPLDLLGQRLVVNPCLKDIRFHKAVEPYAAFQDISMYIAGVLNNKEPPPAPQTDKQKVVSHGLDPKYGFRTPPKEKT